MGYRTMNAIETINLTRKFGKLTAVDDFKTCKYPPDRCLG